MGFKIPFFHLKVVPFQNSIQGVIFIYEDCKKTLQTPLLVLEIIV